MTEKDSPVLAQSIRTLQPERMSKEGVVHGELHKGVSKC